MVCEKKNVLWSSYCCITIISLFMSKSHFMHDVIISHAPTVLYLNSRMTHTLHHLNENLKKNPIL